MTNQTITFKLNRFITTTFNIEPPSPSPSSDVLTLILLYINQCLAAISNFFTSHFGPEARSHWPGFEAHWLRYLVCGVLLLCFVWCCLPPILSCVAWIFVGIFNIIKGLFMMVLNCAKSVFRCLCCCCRRSSRRMMKAPGTGGRMFIPRDPFESNPAAYFGSLRASNNSIAYARLR